MVFKLKSVLQKCNEILMKQFQHNVIQLPTHIKPTIFINCTFYTMQDIVPISKFYHSKRLPYKMHGNE